MSYFAAKSTLEPVRPTTPLRVAAGKGKGRAAASSSSQFVIDDDTDVPTGADPLTATATATTEDAEADYRETWDSASEVHEEASVVIAPHPDSPAQSKSLRGLLSSTSSFFDSPRPAKALRIADDNDAAGRTSADAAADLRRAEAGKARGLEQTLDRIGFGAYQWRLLVSRRSLLKTASRD